MRRHWKGCTIEADYNIFVPQGKYPSGKNEDDALLYVAALTNVDATEPGEVLVIAGEGCGNADDGDDVVDPEEAKADEDEGRSDGAADGSSRPTALDTNLYIAAFIIYGPYWTSRYQAEVFSLLSVDSSAIDKSQKGKRKIEDDRKTAYGVTAEGSVAGSSPRGVRASDRREQLRIDAEVTMANAQLTNEATGRF